MARARARCRSADPLARLGSTPGLALYLIYARLAHQGSRLSAARELEEPLDGCYGVETDLPVRAAQAPDRYVDLSWVERGFRTLKTGLLELRPVLSVGKGNRRRLRRVRQGRSGQ